MFEEIQQGHVFVLPPIIESDDDAEYTNFVNDFADTDFCFRATVPVPKTYKQAISSEESSRWIEAMDEEIKSLHSNNTYSLVPYPADAKVVGGRWVYAVKTDPGGTDRYKARYVAQGFKQINGEDYFETFAPTARMSTVRMLMQISVERGLVVHQLDVKTAYLNAPIDCEIFMKEPKGYETKGENVMVCRLNKAIYGLKQSGRMWNIELDKFLKSHNFKQSPYDPCLYSYCCNGDLVYVLIWVDDIVVAASSDILMNKIKSWLKNRFKMKDLGVINCFLGIQFTVKNGTITMDQSKYLENKLVKFKLDTCKSRTTPCEVTDYESTCDGGVDHRLYREMVGSLIYAMTCTRPDLSWAVSKLSRKLSNPSKGDFDMLKHVFRYVLGTVNYKLTFRKSVNGLQLFGFSDADWAGSKSDRKSTSGYCFMLNHNGPLISWKSRKQDSIALSSCESEYVAACAAAQESIYLARLYNDFAITKVGVDESQTVIHVDNQGAIGLAKNPVAHNKSKHIDIKFHFLRDVVMKKKITLKYVRSQDNVADVFTKVATKIKLNNFKDAMFGI